MLREEIEIRTWNGRGARSGSSLSPQDQHDGSMRRHFCEDGDFAFPAAASRIRITFSTYALNASTEVKHRNPARLATANGSSPSFSRTATG